METPKYTLQDIIKFRKPAYLYAAVSHAEEDYLQNLKAIITNPHKALNVVLLPAECASLAEFFKPYLPGFSGVQFRILVTRTRKEVIDKRQRRRERAPVGILGRMYPLKDYDAFSKYVWEKRGKPRINRKIPSAFTWGEAKTWSERTGENELTYHYMAGCEIATNLRGKKFLKLSINDGREP